MDVALITLLHILVLVYWLGGDLGVFYASTILTNDHTNAQGRITAAHILFQVDMAPRTAMILTLPTGLTLAALKNWIEWPVWAVIGVWFLAGLWLAMAWTTHVRHLPPTSLIRRGDLFVRWGLIVALVGFAGFGGLPLFMALKLIVLAATIALGLGVRAALAPFGAAFGQMVTNGPSPQTDAIIATCLNHTRPLVLCIWALLLCASLLGIAKFA